MDNKQAANLLQQIADLIGPEIDSGSDADMETVAPVALHDLGMMQDAQRLRRYAQSYGGDRLNILIVGTFSNGKSTLVNRLLGGEVVQTGAVPTTAVITHIRQGKPAITVHPHHGASYPLNPHDYWDQYNLEAKTEAETDWTSVDYVEITGQFAESLEGVTLIDTPGLAENQLRTALVSEYLPHANAVIVVLNAKQVLSRTERDFINLLGPGQLQNVFFVINGIDLLQSDTELQRVKNWIHKRLRRHFTSAQGEFSETLYQQRVFFTMALEDNRVRKDKADKSNEMATWQKTLLDWLEHHRRSTTPTELQLLVPVVADVLYRTCQRISYQQNVLQQPLHTLETQLQKSEEQLEQMEQAGIVIQQRIQDTGNVIKHYIYSDLLHYVQTLQSTWETDVDLLELAGLNDLDLLSAKFDAHQQAQVTKVLSQEIQRYTQRKLVIWAQRLPTTLQRNVDELLLDIRYELRDFQVELAAIAGLLTEQTSKTDSTKQKHQASLLTLDETLYAEVFNQKTLLQIIQPMTDKVFTDLSANETLTDIVLATIQGFLDAGGMLLFAGGVGQRLVGFAARIGSDIVRQLRYRREHKVLFDHNHQQQLNQVYGETKPDQTEKLQIVIKACLVESLRSPLFDQMRRVISDKQADIFQQIEAEFDKIGVAIGKKLQGAIKEVRNTQHQLLDIRRSSQATIQQIQETYQTIEQELTVNLDQLCQAALGRTLSESEIKHLSEHRNEFLTRPAFTPEKTKTVMQLQAEIPQELPGLLVSSSLPTLGPEIINSRIQLALAQVLGLEHAEIETDIDIGALGNISTELAQMIGLDSVKQRVLELMDFQSESHRRQASGLNVGEPPSLHLVFTGNPGTGKTTVAEIVGKMYRRLGLLKKGHVISVGRADLVGAYQGHTEQQVAKKIEEAADGVLFIDEAYTLVKNQVQGLEVGQVALDELMRYMEQYRGRLAVVVAGYPNQMRQFLQGNPGLKSRFSDSNVIHFPDYQPEELRQILDRMLAKDSYHMSEEADAVITQVIDKLYEERDTQFGNAREMRNLAQALVRRRATRVQHGQLPVDEPIRPEDFDQEYQSYIRTNPDLNDALALEKALATIKQMIGLSPVKDAIERLVARACISQRLDEKIQADTLHMVFRGAPGTGKTTIAEELGKILKGLGYLRQGHLVPVTRSDLVGSHIGNTEEKTKAKLEEAIDGVLFIDEAYSLFIDGAPNDFGRIVLHELTAYMEAHRDRLVVILAGYPDEIDALLTANAGLRDRFRSAIDFPNYTQGELLQICRKMAQDDGYQLTTDAEGCMTRYLERKRNNDPERFGNARAVRLLLDEMKDRLADRLSPLNDTIIDDVEFRRLAKQLEDKDVPPLPQFKPPSTTQRKRTVVAIDFRIKPLTLDILPAAADHLR